MNKKADLLATLLGLVLTFVLQLAFVKGSWNYVMPDLFKLPAIGWSQAFWLNLLASSLFKNFQSFKNKTE